MSVEFIFRLIGMVSLGTGGLFTGVQIANSAGTSPDLIWVWALVFSLVGALLGIIATPYVTTRPAGALRNLISQMPVQVLISAMIGLITGLIVAALLSLPLSLLPRPFGQIAPFAAVVIFSWLGISIFVIRQSDIYSLIAGRLPALYSGNNGSAATATAANTILIDTSAIIDGRIADISQTGFVSGTILVPRFILNELQHIADSSDVLRRNRGRRGLDVLNKLQKDSAVPVRITDMNVEGVREADDKLVILAKQLHSAILTTDYNLNKVAGIQGVTVLNINDLANAVKAAVLPGERMRIKVIQEGKESGQGVAYLDDGTMVVVEEGRRLMNQTLDVVVTKVLQTAAGRMIFAKPE